MADTVVRDKYYGIPNNETGIYATESRGRVACISIDIEGGF